MPAFICAARDGARTVAVASSSRRDPLTAWRIISNNDNSSSNGIANFAIVVTIDNDNTVALLLLLRLLLVRLISTPGCIPCYGGPLFLRSSVAGTGSSPGCASLCRQLPPTRLRRSVHRSPSSSNSIMEHPFGFASGHHLLLSLA